MCRFAVMTEAMFFISKWSFGLHLCLFCEACCGCGLSGATGDHVRATEV